MIRKTTSTVRNQPTFTGRGPLPETGDPFGAGFDGDRAPVRPANLATEKQINFLRWGLPNKVTRIGERS